MPGPTATNAQPPLDRLRPGLEILRTGPRTFRLFDPASGVHFELHAEERYLLSLLERCSTLDELFAEFEKRFHRPLDEREAREFFEQLRQLNLLSGPVFRAPTFSDTIPHKSSLLRLRGNAANVFFDVLTLLFGWLLNPLWLPVIALGLLFEVLLAAHQWDRFQGDLRLVWGRYPLLPLLLLSYVQTVLLLNLPLALMTGICCRRFKGRVRSFGLTWGNWVLPTISFFTDIGDSLVLMDKRGRRTQVALGILMPMALSAVYALLWAASSRATHAYQFWSLMLIPTGLMTVYQCNPFSVYASGHWALALALDDWQLHSRALKETHAWLLGRTSPEALLPSERRWLRAYGLCHYLTRGVLDVTLFFVGGAYLISHFGPAGAAAFLVLVAWWNSEHLSRLWELTGDALWHWRRAEPQPATEPQPLKN